MAFRDQCVKKVEMKSWAVLGAKFYVRASYQEKTGKGSFAPTPILNRIKYIYIYICLWHDKLFILWYEQKNYAGVMLQINMVQLASNTIKSTAITTSKCYLILNVHTIIKA